MLYSVLEDLVIVVDKFRAFSTNLAGMIDPKEGYDMDNEAEIKELTELWKKIPKELQKQAIEQLRLLLHGDAPLEESSE